MQGREGPGQCRRIFSPQWVPDALGTAASLGFSGLFPPHSSPLWLPGTILTPVQPDPAECPDRQTQASTAQMANG